MLNHPGKLHESRSSFQNQSLTKTDKNLNNVDNQEVSDFRAISLYTQVISKVGCGRPNRPEFIPHPTP